MKKLLSLFLAGVILISSLTFSTTAFAENEANCKGFNTYAEEQIETAGEYLTKLSDRYTLDNAADFLLYLKSGVVTDTQKKYFIKSVNENFEANNGRLIDSNGESLGTYGAVIQAYEIMHLDTGKIREAFEKMDPNSYCNPYYYRLAIECASEDYAKQICKAFIDQYYKLGEGMDYWGFGCDNTAYFLTAIAKYKDDFSEYVEDAKKLLKTYSTEQGAFFNSMYGTQACADSTAASMMAFASIGESEEAFGYYKKLTENFESSKGIFKYTTEINDYSTKGALLALEYFVASVDANNYKNTQHIYTTKITKYNNCTKADTETKTCKICGNKVVKNLTAVKKHSYTSKVTKAPTSSNTGVMTYTCKDCGYKYTKSISKLAKASISSVTPMVKGFKVTWKAVSSATGYELQYSRNSNMSNSRKREIANASRTSTTYSKIGKKTKYYVRIRTYRTINGKKYYSDWSSKKSVITK